MSQTHDPRIFAAFEKGIAPAAIARLLDHTIEDVNAALGLDCAPEINRFSRPQSDYTPEALEKVASEALYVLACQVHEAPLAFKPGEALAIIREALDRTKGKPVQTTIMDQYTTYTIVAAIPAPPNSLRLPPIDIECEAQH